jgi:hypothetical protein
MDKLQVFISWSGTRSHAIAKHIKAWLPDVVRNAEPWLSSEDLRKGLQWLPELNKNLSNTGFGLLVLTADNKDAPWLVFEAGVISKALPDRHCCPLLCDLKQTDMSGPLTQFQSTAVTKKEDMLQLVKTMNDACGASKVEEERIGKWFSTSWDEFNKQVGKALLTKSAGAMPAKAEPTERELLEEVLATVRQQAIEPRMRMEELMRDVEGPLVVPPDIVMRTFSRIHPRIQEELIDFLRKGQGDPEWMHELMHMVRCGPRSRNRLPEDVISQSEPEDQKELSRGVLVQPEMERSIGGLGSLRC